MDNYIVDNGQRVVANRRRCWTQWAMIINQNPNDTGQNVPPRLVYDKYFMFHYNNDGNAKCQTANCQTFATVVM